MSHFPVCCYTCRKVVNPYYEPFRRRVREIQSAAAELRAAKAGAGAGVCSEPARAESGLAAEASQEGEPKAAASADRLAQDMEALSSGSSEKDMVAGALSGLGIHNLCCRILFLSFVDTEMDDLASRGEHLGRGVYARTAGELSGTVRIIRGPSGGRRAKPSVLLAR
jgi:DNA-directed RNA polymerase subunit N (RpoN/RPB10)